ncbi:hypothetical protein PAPYR_12274 [Paratrimastix pyriformis]|uniref:Uncharacterized protein n=1 Tax=Paratrimastix pyriformis TaxID=342808 RepID=A0ABQ8U241_9EUKA|nr:hypothetical protein PAPYR_12274 [Paratrimastix pyriformis]
MGYKSPGGLSFNEDKAARLAAGASPRVETLQWIVTGSGAWAGRLLLPPSVKAVMVEALAAACLLNLVAYPRARLPRAGCRWWRACCSGRGTPLPG